MERHRQSDPPDSDGDNFATEFRYQPALPIARGKLAMWLFLSTEVMFFTALIGSYVVLRLASGTWPEPGDVQVRLSWGIINTLILMVSGVTMAWALRATGRGRATVAKSWLVVSLLLGSAFLGIKAWEYRVKYSHGIYPSSRRSSMFDQADERYLGGTVAAMRKAIKRLQQEPAGAPRDRRLADLFLLQSGVIDWTQYKVGRSGDPLMNRRAIETLAHQIYPLADSSTVQKYLVDENREIDAQLKRLEEQQRDAETRLGQAQQKLKLLLPQKDSADVDIRNQFDRETQNAARWVESISAIQTELDPVLDRQAALAQLDATQGINEQFQLNLPIVVPGGNTWVSVYYLLTGSHVLHLLAGLLVIAALIPFRLDVSRYPFLENVTLYWHFVDLVWLMVFAILYLT